MPPFVIAIHPDEVDLGAALIVAAAGAVRRDGGGVVAAWDVFHTNVPLPTERAVEAMLTAAEATLACPCACFSFLDRPRPRAPGLVSADAVFDEDWRELAFEPALAALDADVAAGGLGLAISNGVALRSLGREAAFRPGILHLRPCRPGDEVYRTKDVFTRGGFPTLVVSDTVVPGGISAHEGLEWCARLAAHMAADLLVAA